MHQQSAVPRREEHATNRVSGIDPSPGRLVTPLRAEFETLPSAIFQRLPVALLCKDPAPTKAEVVCAYAEVAAEIEACGEDLARFGEALCLAMVEVRGCDDESRLQKTLESTVSAIKAEVTPGPPPHLPPLDAPLVASVSADCLAGHVRKLCARASANIAAETVRLLEQLTEGQRVTWHGDGVAEIRFKRVVIVEEPAPTTRTAYDASTRQRVEYRDFLQTRRSAVHHHDLIGAIKVPLTARSVARPDWIEELIRRIPDWLEPYAAIATGDLFRARIIERDEKTETVSEKTGVTDRRERALYKPDPALLIGEFAIAGWTDLDLQEEDRRARRVRQAGWARLAAAVLALVASLAWSILTGVLPFGVRFDGPFEVVRQLYVHINGLGSLAFGPAIVGLIAYSVATAAYDKSRRTATKASQK